MNAPNRFYTLDAMRGLAAIAVVILHAQHLVLPGGTIAVDFFFALSGFVISRTYDARLAAGLGAGRFLGQRVVRLYPLYLAGLLLGAARIATPSFTALGSYSSWDLGLSALLGLFFLPSVGMTELGALNAPSWSLYMEMLANVLYAFVLVRRSTRWLFALMAASAGAIAVAAVLHGSADLGVVWTTAGGGVARVVFGFCLGMVMARMHRANIDGGWMCLVPIGMLLGAMLAPGSRNDRAFMDIAVMFTVVPVSLWLGATLHLPMRFSRAASALGQISYPPYAIHFPLLLWTTSGPVQTHHLRFGIWFPVYLLGVLCLAWILARTWDPIARASLKSTLRHLGHRLKLLETAVPR